MTGRLFLIEILQLADGPIRGRRRSSADKSIDSAGFIDERDTAGRLADLRGFFFFVLWLSWDRHCHGPVRGLRAEAARQASSMRHRQDGRSPREDRSDTASQLLS